MNENPNQPLSAPETKNQTWIWVFVVGCGCLVLLIAAVVLGGFGYYFFMRATPTPPVPSILPEPSATSAPDSPSVPSGDANTLGNPNAPVTIIEYADFQCPFCYRFWHDTQPLIVDTYVNTGHVYLIYRSAGEFIGPESGKAAQAAYCAGDEGKFWEYHDILYAHQGGENTGAFSENNLLEFANGVGLDSAQFGDCLRSGKYARRVEQDAADMQAAGISGTPSFLVNGNLVEGAQPFDVFQQVIEDALNGAGGGPSSFLRRPLAAFLFLPWQ